MEKPANDDIILQITILFGVIAALVAGFPLALENSSPDIKVSVGWGLLVIGYVFFIYFMFTTRLIQCRKTIDNKERASREIVKNLTLYFVLAFTTNFIINYVLSEHIPNKNDANLIGISVYVPLYFVSHFAITLASREKNIYVGEQQLIHDIEFYIEKRFNIKNFVETYGVSTIEFFMLFLVTFAVIGSFYYPFLNQKSMIFNIALIISVLIASLLSYTRSVYDIRERLIKVNKITFLKPKNRIELLKMLSTAYIVFIVVSLILLIVFTVVIMNVIGFKNQSSDGFLTSETLASIIAVGLSFICSSHIMVIRKYAIDKIEPPLPLINEQI